MGEFSKEALRKATKQGQIETERKRKEEARIKAEEEKRKKAEEAAKRKKELENSINSLKCKIKEEASKGRTFADFMLAHDKEPKKDLIAEVVKFCKANDLSYKQILEEPPAYRNVYESDGWAGTEFAGWYHKHHIMRVSWE